MNVVLQEKIDDTREAARKLKAKQNLLKMLNKWNERIVSELSFKLCHTNFLKSVVINHTSTKKFPALIVIGLRKSIQHIALKVFLTLYLVLS